jgi:hypothetical protein
MPNLNERTLLAFRDELPKLAEVAPYTPGQMYAVHRRFDTLANLMKTQGVYSGTAHRRILIPKDKLTENDIGQLGFVPVTIAIPEAGQDRFRSFRHPDMNYHIHSHPEGWTMHEDQHAASTMLARKEKGVLNKTKAMVSGIPHVNEEGVPGLYYYLKGRLAGHKSTAQSVAAEMPDPLRARIARLSPSRSYVAPSAPTPAAPPPVPAAPMAPPAPMGGVKQAGYGDLVARAAPRLKNIGSLGGIGATLGALGGAGVSGVSQYHQARQQGSGRGEAALLGTLGALGGAGRGALLGAGVGGVAGALMKGDTSFYGQRGGLLGAGARFGQRQVHSVTGMLAPRELEAVRGGAFGARQALDTARAGVPKATAAAQSAVHAAEGRLGAVESAQNMGLSSIPGVIGAVRREGVGKVLQTGAREQLHGAGPLGALMVAAPALATAKSLTNKDEFDEQGRGKGERVGEELGRTVGGVTGGVMPIVGQGLLGSALGGAGRVMGRGVDRLRGKGSAPGMAPATLEPAEGQHTPSERLESPSAAGQQKDIGL